MMAKVTVKLQLGEWPSESDITACLDVSPQLIMQAAQKLDIPKDGTDPITKTFCTPTETILDVKKFRQMAGREIGIQIGAFITQAFGYHDTENGYKKNEH